MEFECGVDTTQKLSIVADGHTFSELEFVVENAVAHSRLTFDGFKLKWHGTFPVEYDAFSGLAGLSARESEVSKGPIPQGLFVVHPDKIEELEPSNGWGKYRVIIWALTVTRTRMKRCFGVVRKQLYIHGGSKKGTSGCIEINNDEQEERFFSKLKAYPKKIELEVRYHRNLKDKLEEPKCPY